MRKCINCKWNGEEELNKYNNCPVCGDNTVETGTPKPEPIVEEKVVEKPKVDPINKPYKGKKR